jgi:hypothetical protein
MKMDGKMNNGSVSIPINLIGTVLTGLIAAAATIYGILASRKKDNAEATSEMSNAWKVTVVELREEIKRLRERVEESEKKNEDAKIKMSLLEQKLTNNERELEKTIFQLGLAKETIDVALSWMNEYAPALKRAGIEPLDVDRLKFRGEKEPAEKEDKDE